MPVHMKGEVMAPRDWAELLTKARTNPAETMPQRRPPKTLLGPPRVSAVAKPAPAISVAEGISNLARSVVAAIAPRTAARRA